MRLCLKFQDISWNTDVLTDARNDVELVVDLLVHGGGDDADSGEGVGHRVDAHLGHEQRHQEELVLRDVVVLQKMTGGAQPPQHLDLYFASETCGPTSRTRMAMSAAAPVETVLSIRMT